MPRKYDFYRIIKKYLIAKIHPKTQEKLNRPLKKEGVGSAHKGYLGKLVRLLEKEKIDLIAPETIFNPEVYGKLKPKDKTLVDREAVNIVSALRQIEKLWEQKHEDSFQLENLVELVWQMKERIEKRLGDVYKV